MDKNDVVTILEKIAEVSERTSKMEVQIGNITENVKFIKDEDIKQNKLLDIHIQGTITNTERLNLEIVARKDFESRLEDVEKIPQFFSSLKKVLVYAGVIIGIVYESGRIFKYW